MINIDNLLNDVYGGGGGAGIPAVSLPVTTPVTPSTPVPPPTTAPGVPGGAMATRPSMSIYDVFKNINNKTSYGSNTGSPAAPGIPAMQGGGAGGGWGGTTLATTAQLLNPVKGSTQVSRSLQDLLNPNSAYVQNARQRGAEQAQARGGINSSIAAGASERAAMEAVQPLVQQAVDIDQQKYKLLAEDYLAQQGYKAQFGLADKQDATQRALAEYNGGLQMSLAQQRANTENWLSEQNFGRAMFGQTFANSMGMLNMVQQYGLEDPELYTPEVLSGYTNFFQQNMNDLLSRYFGG